MRVFLDTNILLDALVERQDRHFNENASIILQLGKNGVFELFMSVLSIPTMAYVLKNLGGNGKKSIIKNICALVTPIPALPDHIDAMLESRMDDIEDAMQVQSARTGNCDLIITRDRSDFKNADFPFLYPEEFLERVLW